MEECDSRTSIQIHGWLVPIINETHQFHTFTDTSRSEIAATVYVRTNQRRWFYHITTYGRQNKSGTDQAAEHNKTGIGSGNTWIRASWVLWERDENYYNSKALGQIALLHLDGSNPSRDRRCTLPTDRPKFTRILTQTTGDKSLGRIIKLTTTNKASSHQTTKTHGVNHRTFWSHLKVPWISPRTVIST